MPPDRRTAVSASWISRRAGGVVAEADVDLGHVGRGHAVLQRASEAAG